MSQLLTSLDSQLQPGGVGGGVGGDCCQTKNLDETYFFPFFICCTFFYFGKVSATLGGNLHFTLFALYWSLAFDNLACMGGGHLEG